MRDVAVDQVLGLSGDGTDFRDAATEGAESGSRLALASGIRYDQTRVLDVSAEEFPERRVIALQGDAAAKRFKVLRAQVLAKLRQEGWNSLIVTGPTRGCGATMTAVNLAATLALDVNQTVLLVDLDLRAPAVREYFTDEQVPGIADYLIDGRLPSLLFNPGIERLVVLPGSEPLVKSSELLAAPPMVELIEEMKSRYASRILIFDMPPVLDGDDVLTVAPRVDSVLLVARDGWTSQNDLEKSFQLLRKTPVIGTVLNAVAD